MRDFGDDSSAGSTPPPSNLDSFSPSGFFAEVDPPPAAGAELWTHLELDGWCFNSDNHQEAFRPASSEPLRLNIAAGGARRPPRPSRGSSSNKRKHPMRADHFDHQYFQECDDSVGNLNSMVQSLASENDKDETSWSESDESEIQSDLPANENRPPEMGMEFSSEEEAYKFYKKYADEVGFSVRRGKVQRLTSGAIRKRSFLCSRQGFKVSKFPNNATKYKRKETRTGCNASIQFTVEDGDKWVVSSFISEHNHELEKLKKTLSEVQVNSLDCLPDGTSNTLQPENVQSLLNCFLNFQAKDPMFFNAIQVDAANRATNFFWRDFRSLSDYSYFADVVVFDTMCRTDNVVCACFWGLNHHRQRILFCGALLLDETLESFVWLFRVFAAAMDGRPPDTLYSTDESREIAIAAETVFPKTKHRLSASNVRMNAERHLSGCFEQRGFEEVFDNCVFDCRSKEEFESRWDSLLDRYNLRENSWIVNVRRLWEKWSHFAAKKTFTAGVEAYFDSPRFDSVFRKPDNEITSLSDFFQKYVKEVKKARLVELQEDLRCSEKSNSRSRKGMEKHAEDLYTCAMFEKFQDELLDSLSFAIEEVSSSAKISTFRLKEEGQKKEEIVTFDPSDSSVTCSCGKFESIGILCGHCLKVLNAKNIFQIPPRYIVKRWAKSAKEKASAGSENENQNHKPLTSYSRNIMHKTLDIITKSIGIEESRNMVEGYLDLALKKAKEILKEKGPQIVDSKSLELDDDENNCVFIDGIRYLKSKEIASNSSCTDQEQGPENNAGEIGLRSHDHLGTTSVEESIAFYQSGGLSSSQLQMTGVFNEISAPVNILRSKCYSTQDSAVNQENQAELQSTAHMPIFEF